MSSSTPFFKAFGPLLFGRPGRAAFKKLARLNSLQELYELFGHLIPERLLAASEAGANSRERVFTPQVTFWAFVAQILSPGSSCREIVRRVDAWWQQTAGESGSLSGSTSAYCQARARLDPDALELVSGHLCWSLERNVLAEERWLGGRPVKIVDGTGLSMPDTAANQVLWPQPTAQQPGCGFPMMKLVGLFSLAQRRPAGDRHWQSARPREPALSQALGSAQEGRCGAGRPRLLFLRRPRQPATTGRGQCHAAAPETARRLPLGPGARAG